MSQYRQAFKKAFPYTIPVLTGYLFIGIAFGVMYAEKGYSFVWAILMSLLVYAGSGQYLAVNFFVPGISFLQVIFLTFMVNVRHVFYGISLLEKFNKMGKSRWYMKSASGSSGRKVSFGDRTFESILLGDWFCNRWFGGKSSSDQFRGN